MGRIRTIKPELIEHEKFATLSDAAARLFYGLVHLADDAGRCTAAPGFLAGNVFWGKPRSANSIGKLVSELESAGWIRTYVINGVTYFEIIGWRSKGAATFQQLDKSKGYVVKFPAPESISGSPTGSLDPDPDPDPEGISGQRDRQKDDDIRRLIRQLPDGLRPPAGGGEDKAERIMRRKRAEGVDLEEQLRALVEHQRTTGDEIRNPTGLLLWWFGRARSDEQPTKAKASKKARTRTPAKSSQAKPESRESPEPKPAKKRQLEWQVGHQLEEKPGAEWPDLECRIVVRFDDGIGVTTYWCEGGKVLEKHASVGAAGWRDHRPWRMLEEKRLDEHNVAGIYLPMRTEDAVEYFAAERSKAEAVAAGREDGAEYLKHMRRAIDKDEARWRDGEAKRKEA